MTNNEHIPIGHRINPKSHIQAEDIYPKDIVDSMGFYGTLGSTLNSLDAKHDTETITQNFWSSSLLLKSIINHTPPNHQDRIGLIDEATNLMAEHYAGYEYRDRLIRIRHLIGQVGISLTTNVTHKLREDTGWASSPVSSSATARRLKGIIQQPILFIPICHSGVPTGVQTLLYYRKSYPDSTLYPIRYSIRTGYDMYPIISDQEKSHISSLSDHRAVVVIDDVACSGRTITDVVRSLDDFILKPANIIAIANDDRRQSTEYDQQGRYWEKITSRSTKISDTVLSRTISRTLHLIMNT